jgi:hypothetical protein
MRTVRLYRVLIVFMQHVLVACGRPLDHFNEQFTLLFPSKHGPMGLDSLVDQIEQRTKRSLSIQRNFSSAGDSWTRRQQPRISLRR